MIYEMESIKLDIQSERVNVIKKGKAKMKGNTVARRKLATVA